MSEKPEIPRLDPSESAQQHDSDDGPRRRARLTVVAGPTAVGKGTIVAALRRLHPELVVSLSATTRAPRPGERDGVHYRFVSDSEFDRMIDAGELLEWALVHGAHRYGTPRGPVEAALAQGRDVLLEVDLAGARQVRGTKPEARFVFIMPPTVDDLVARLARRGTEDEAERARRLATAQVEMAAAGEFEHVIINDDVDRATTQLAAVMGLAD